MGDRKGFRNEKLKKINSFHKNQTRRRDLRVSGDEAPPFPFRHLTCTVRVSRALRVKMSENVFYRRLAVISEPGSCCGCVCVACGELPGSTCADVSVCVPQRAARGRSVGSGC